METDKMSTASSVGTSRRPLLQALVIERRILFACTVLVGLSTLVWITAVCTEKWVHIESGVGIYLSSKDSKGIYFMSSEAGIWQNCRYIFQATENNATIIPKNITGLTGQYYTSNAHIVLVTIVTYAMLVIIFSVKIAMKVDYFRNSVTAVVATKLFTDCTNYLAPPVMNVTNKKEFADPAFDIVTANYVRTMISFGIIGLFVMMMGCGFSAYTFLNPRYMFKRLAAGIHFISTSCTFVVVQVMMSTVDHWKTKKEIVYPNGANHYFHVSFFLGWFVVLVNVFAAASFLWYSRKRKGDKAATDELAMADEPTIIGR